MSYTNCKITITGDLGSGKSTVMKIIMAAHNFQTLSTGKIQRKLAQEMGMTTLELNKLAETDPSIDKKIDSVFETIRADGLNYAIDSRMAWHFIPESFKVYLQTDVHTAAKRIRQDDSRKREKYQSDLEAVKQLVARKKSENERFQVKYGVDCANLDNFDLVINTAAVSPEEVAKLIMLQLDQYLANPKAGLKKWYAPTILYPSLPLSAFQNVPINPAAPQQATNSNFPKRVIEVLQEDSNFWLTTPEDHHYLFQRLQNKIYSPIPVHVIPLHQANKTFQDQINQVTENTLATWMKVLSLSFDKKPTIKLV